MRVEATLSFQGDFGPGTQIVSYDVGQMFDAPDRIAQKWIGRGLVKPATTKKRTHTEAVNDGE